MSFILVNDNGISREEAFRLILDRFPAFSSSWKEHRAYWGDDVPGTTIDFSVFMQFAAEHILAPKADQELQALASIIERLVTEGDSDVEYGAIFGFLEGITNVVLDDPAKYDFSTFVRYAGPKTVGKLKEIDEFWGTNTPGI